MGKALVEYEYFKKSNILNTISGGDFTKPAHELFIMFLAALDPNKPPQENIRFYIKDYKWIFGTGRRNPKYLDKLLDGYDRKKFKIYNEKGYPTNIYFFSRTTVDEDENGDVYVEFVPTKEAYPLFFEIKSNYTQYSIKAIANLSTYCQRRMYEILKEPLYKGIDEITIEIPLDELKRRVGSTANEYRIFKTKVLDESKKAFENNAYSEIRFTYDKICGAHGKVKAVKFTITRNIIDIKEENDASSAFPDDNQKPDELNKESSEQGKPTGEKGDTGSALSDNAPKKKEPTGFYDADGISHIFEPNRDFLDEEIVEFYGNKRNAEIAHSTQYEFSKDEIDEIVLLMTDLDIDIAPDDEEIHLVGRSAAEWSKKEKYIRRLYSKLQSSVKRYKVKSDNRARYFIKMLENAIKEMAKTSTASDKNNPKKETSYDLDEWEEFAENYIHNLIKNKETDSTSE